MPAIGITGGISTGKSTLVECLRELLPVATFFNADEAAHALLNRPEVQKQIRRDFGAQVFSAASADEKALFAALERALRSQLA